MNESRSDRQREVRNLEVRIDECLKNVVALGQQYLESVEESTRDRQLSAQQLMKIANYSIVAKALRFDFTATVEAMLADPDYAVDKQAMMLGLFRGIRDGLTLNEYLEFNSVEHWRWRKEQIASLEDDSRDAISE